MKDGIAEVAIPAAVRNLYALNVSIIAADVLHGVMPASNATTVTEAVRSALTAKDA